jgi:hypothetical protein
VVQVAVAAVAEAHQKVRIHLEQVVPVALVVYV